MHALRLCDTKVKNKSIKNANGTQRQRIESEANELLKPRVAAAMAAETNDAEWTASACRRRLCLRSHLHQQRQHNGGSVAHGWTSSDNGQRRRQRRQQRDLLKVSQRKAAATRRTSAVAKVAFDIRSSSSIAQQQQQQQRAPITAWTACTATMTTTTTTAAAAANNAATTMTGCSSPVQIAPSVQTLQPLPSVPSHHDRQHGRRMYDSSKSSRHDDDDHYHHTRDDCICGNCDTAAVVVARGWSDEYSSNCRCWECSWRTDAAQQHSHRTTDAMHLAGAMRHAVPVDDDKMVVRSTVEASNRLPDRTQQHSWSSICCPTSSSSSTAIGRLWRQFGARLNDYNFSRSTIQFLGAICQQGMCVCRSYTGAQRFFSNKVF